MKLTALNLRLVVALITAWLIVAIDRPALSDDLVDTNATLVDPAGQVQAASWLPFVGAQVFIEPGHTEEDIENWFEILREHGFTACRIRIFEDYARDGSGAWNFGLFDHAFAAAERNGVDVWATLQPSTKGDLDFSASKFPENAQQLQSIADFIDAAVGHFRSKESLAGWVLMNEPGVQGQTPRNPLARHHFEDWLAKHPTPATTHEGYPLTLDFSSEKFLRDYTTWYLGWIADRVTKSDSGHDVHVNCHNIFVNCAEYDFPAWRGFLTSLGGSAHASWHFGYFDRRNYAVAMSADCEMIRAGAGPLPWFMTEIQGGNNIYSGFHPLCPTAKEIAQWLWIAYGAEAKGAIFWTLNPRSSGIEAGEWAMLNLQDKPTDRLTAAGKVAAAIHDNAELFSHASKAPCRFNVLYVPESLWAETKMTGSTCDYDARSQGGVMKSSLAWFEALGEMGVSANLMSLEEFNFTEDSYTGQTIILSHQLSLPTRWKTPLRDFVARGGKLIVDGLTAYFDEHMHHTMRTGFHFEDLFGGNVSEYQLVDKLFNLNTPGAPLRSHLWKGQVVASSGQAITSDDEEPVAIRHRLGDGEVFWMPSLVGLGGRLEGDYSGIQRLLRAEAPQSLDSEAVRFRDARPRVLMKTLQSKQRVITVVVNKSDKPQQVHLVFKDSPTAGETIFPVRSSVDVGGPVLVQPEETIVTVWQ